MLLLVDDSINSSSPGCLGAIDGIQEFTAIVKQKITVHTTDVRGAGDALPTGQLDASRILDAMESVRSDHDNQPVFVLTAHDITGMINGRALNFIFGVSRTARSAIVSTYQFELGHLTGSATRACLRLITMHELGHIWGLVGVDAARTEQRNGLYTDHCTNLCTMRQVLSVDEANRLIFELGSHSFCAECLNDLTNSRS